jgi:hypothetical protein
MRFQDSLRSQFHPLLLQGESEKRSVSSAQ